jgi:hypothetical protein
VVDAGLGETPLATVAVIATVLWNHARTEGVSRSITEVGRGDFIKIGDGRWKEILDNPGMGSSGIAGWLITTTDGSTYDMYDIRAYARAGDFRN